MLLACAVLAGLAACAAPVAMPSGARPAAAAAADEAPQPLVAGPASAAAGRAVFTGRDAGNCVLCHRIAGLDVPFQGDVGPDLTAVGARLTPAQLRLRIIDAARLNPATVMPPYWRTTGLDRVAGPYRGRTVLAARQIEDLVAFLATLRGSAPDLAGGSPAESPP